MTEPEHTFVDPSYTEPEVASGPEERERESAHTEETRYDREQDAEAAARHEAAERLKAEGPLEPAGEEQAL
jgi:hypothetical protein